MTPEEINAQYSQNLETANTLNTLMQLQTVLQHYALNGNAAASALAERNLKRLDKLANVLVPVETGVVS
jgi:hypothetical protein